LLLFSLSYNCQYSIDKPADFLHWPQAYIFICSDGNKTKDQDQTYKTKIKTKTKDARPRPRPVKQQQECITEKNSSVVIRPRSQQAPRLFIYDGLRCMKCVVLSCRELLGYDKIRRG